MRVTTEYIKVRTSLLLFPMQMVNLSSEVRKRWGHGPLGTHWKDYCVASMLDFNKRWYSTSGDTVRSYLESKKMPFVIHLCDDRSYLWDAETGCMIILIHTEDWILIPNNSIVLSF